MTMRPTCPAFATLLTLASGLLSPALCAQIQGDPVIVLRENEVVPNLGTIQTMTRIAVSDQGTVFTEATTDSDSLIYMMRDGFPTFINNLPLAEPSLPAMHTMRSMLRFNSFELDANTNVVWLLQSNNSASDSASLAGNHTGIYFNLNLIHNDLDTEHTFGDIGLGFEFEGSTPGFLPNFGYQIFRGIDISNDGRILINCEVDSNGIAMGGNTARALVLTEIDTFGNITGETLLAMGTSNNALTNLQSAGISSAQNTYQVSDNGNWIATVRFNSVNGQVTTNNDDWAIVANSIDNIIVREGDVIAGIGTVSATGVASGKAAINAFGDIAYMARFASNLDHIVVNGEVLAAEGTAALNLPSLAPNSVRDLGLNTGPPLRISDSGDVYWSATISGANSTNRAFMRNQEVLIRKGVSRIDGVLIREILFNSPRGFALSENGRFWAGMVQLAGGGDNAMILYDLGLVVPIPGCGANPSTLTKLSGDARLGELLVLSMDGAQGPGALPSMHFSLQPAILDSPCGIMTSFGELLINFTPGIRLGKIAGVPVTSGPSSIGVNIPINTALVGMEIFAQGLFFDPGSANGGPAFSLTNGMQLIIGAS